MNMYRNRNMNNNYYTDNRLVIKCVHCRNKLRVPLDKGKITVKCPACKKEFRYNPKSILDTLRQIALDAAVWVSKKRRR
jgi:ribosomal protein S27E